MPDIKPNKQHVTDEELEYLIPLLKSGNVIAIAKPPYTCLKCKTPTVTLFKYIGDDFECRCETCNERLREF